mmetsp:Transcript_28777/g.42297  ORF Transcript_28777/g.42297 Transcript_28777/m.42297 type:complete len:127 (-) Transcript_28777:28-408(-)
MPNPGPPAGAEVEHIQIRLLLHRSKAEPAPLVLHICFEILLEGLMHGRRVMGGHRPRAVGARIVPHGPHCKTLSVFVVAVLIVLAGLERVRAKVVETVRVVPIGTAVNRTRSLVQVPERAEQLLQH